tara:strand:- start:5579 stop:5920 length:342 start_codon:yes stop_codon:yes gene_type:complete
MSEVTSLIISFSIGEDEKSRMNEVNLFLNNGRGFKINSADFEEGTNWLGKENRKRRYGGSKMLEIPLYMGAFNHLDLEGLIDHMKELEWEEPENVQLMVKVQESDKFEIFELK